MKRTGPRTATWETPQVKRDERDIFVWIATADVRDERHEVSHYGKIEEMPNQVERRWSRTECYQRQQRYQEDKGKRLVAYRWR